MKYRLVTSFDLNTWSKENINLVINPSILNRKNRVEKDYKLKIVNLDSNYDNDLDKLSKIVSENFNIFLPLISETLNDYHGLKLNKNDWNLLLGAWLFRCISTLIYKYKIIEDILRNYKIVEISTFDLKSSFLASKDSLSFINDCENDVWNNLIYNKIIDSFKTIKVKKKFFKYQKKIDNNLKIRKLNLIKSFLKNLFLIKLPNLLYRETDAFIIDSYLPFYDELKLNFLLRQLPRRFIFPSIIKKKIINRKNELKLKLKSKDPMHQFLCKTLPFLVPMSFVENYLDLKAVLKKMPWPDKPKFIFTSNAYDFNDFFKLWALEKSFQSCKLFVGQHGNNYFTHKFFGSPVLPERSCSDGFITWGWDDGLKNTIQGFNFKINKKKFNFNPSGGVVLCSQILENQWVPWNTEKVFFDSLQNNKIFINKLNKDIQSSLSLRIKYSDLNEQSLEYINKNFVNLTIDRCKKNFYEIIKYNRLFIFNYDSTGILELLAGDIPFIAFWNNKYSHINKHAVKHYKKMFDCGIFHDNPITASKLVNRIWKDVYNWWNSKAVRVAKDDFRNNFSRYSENIPKDLLYKINNHINKT